MGSFLNDDCACGGSDISGPCAELRAGFAIHPASLDCQTNPDRLTLEIRGVDPNVRNLNVVWFFVNVETPGFPGRHNIEGPSLTMEIRQVDPNERVRLGARITYHEPGQPSTSGAQCVFVVGTPSTNSAWAWDVYEINGDPGQIMIDGPTFIDATATGMPTGPHRYTRQWAVPRNPL